MHWFIWKKIYKLFLGRKKKIWRLPAVVLSKNWNCDSGNDSTPNAR